MEIPEYKIPEYEIEYYSDNTRISNSAIGWFLNKGPSYLRRMLDGKEKGLNLPQLRKGTMIHEYLLQPEKFWNDYMLFEGEKPKSTQAQKFCENLANTVELELSNQLSNAYRKSYSIVGKSEDKILSEALKMSVEYKDYIEAIKKHKILISEYDVKQLNDIWGKVIKHKMASKLLREAKAYGNIHVYHEFQINWEFAGFKVPCKSLLDSCTFDFNKKECTIMDIKTTAKLWHFEDSMKEFDYCRQIAFYKKAVLWYLQNVYNYSMKEACSWKFNFYIIAIDTTGSNDVRVFQLNDINFLEAINEIYGAIKEISWHIENNEWDHSRKYYEGDGSENLNL